MHRSNQLLFRVVAFLAVLALFWGIFPLVAGASTRETITDDLGELFLKDYSGNSPVVMIHSAPSAKSKTLFEWDTLDQMFAEVIPVIDKSDNSKWYKIILIQGYADFIRQVHKLAQFNYSYGYVNANFVEIRSVDSYVNEEMANIRANKPPHKKVGDDFRAESEGRLVGTLEVPVTILKAPKDGAEKITIPAGLKYVSYAEGTEDNFPVYYNDINEVDWALIVSADTYKVLGWMKAEEWAKIPWEEKM